MTGNTNLQPCWAYQIAYNAATNHTPFSLAFGMEAIIPMEYLVPSLRVVVRERLTKEALSKWFVKLSGGNTIKGSLWDEG